LSGVFQKVLDALVKIFNPIIAHMIQRILTGMPPARNCLESEHGYLGGVVIRQKTTHFHVRLRSLNGTKLF
jgi:hypothetical protein